MMHEKSILQEAARTLKSLADSGITKDFYMAGGTAAALYLGHRVSLDLDFFSPDAFDNIIMIERLKSLGRLNLEKESWGTIWCVLNKTKLSFFVYKYPLLGKPGRFNKVKIASLLDIACIKAAAISSLGTRRDFIDLYMICRDKIAFRKVLDGFVIKYRSVNYNMLHILKSLVYFQDAEKEPMPKMLIDLDWPDVKRFFEKEISAQKL